MFNRKISYNQVGAGTAFGVTPIILFGRNPTPTTTNEVIWEDTNVYTPLSAAAAMTISSSSGSDDVGSTGATTCRVTGILSTGVETTETVSMDGQNGVSLANQYIAINNIEVTEAGTNRSNLGIIYVGTGSITTGRPTAPSYAVPVDYSKRGTMMYWVPTGKTLLIHDFGFEIKGTSSTHTWEGSIVSHSGGVFRNEFVIGGNYISHFYHAFPYPIKIPESTHVQFRGLVATAVAYHAYAFCTLVDNDSSILSL